MPTPTLGRVQGSGQAWFDEIDLDPSVSWRRMGTRPLGDRPWLVADERRVVELALKQRLLAERHDEVFAVESGAEEAGRETLELVEAEHDRLGLDGSLPGGDDGPGVGVEARHPLDRAGRLVQEDLCLLRRSSDGWVLAGASLCFPSRWRLAEKMGRSMTAVHEPVDGYDPALAGPVDRLFDRLDQRIFLRRNWFVHPDPALFQPDRPVGGDPLVSADGCLDELHLRSERQTVRRLPVSGWVLFTVRIQQDPLGSFVADPERARALVRYLAEAPDDQLRHRGISAPQAEQLGLALDTTLA